MHLTSSQGCDSHWALAGGRDVLPLSCGIRVGGGGVMGGFRVSAAWRGSRAWLELNTGDHVQTGTIRKLSLAASSSLEQGLGNVGTSLKTHHRPGQ